MLQLYQIGMRTVCAVQQLKVIDDTLDCNLAKHSQARLAETVASLA
jgi:hypothetical protein